MIRLDQSERESWYIATGLRILVISLSIHIWFDLAKVTTQIPAFQWIAGIIVLFMLVQPMRWYLWIPATIFTGWISYVDRLAVPNHHVLLSFMTLAVSLSLTARNPDKRREAIMSNAQWLLVLTFVFAGLHKLISVNFMEGAFPGFMLIQGSIGKFPLDMGLFPEAKQIMETNREMVSELFQTMPQHMNSATLAEPFAFSAQISVALAWSTFLIEVVLALLFVFKPRERASHLCLIGFGASLVIIRPEVIFLATFLSMGLLTCPRNFLWIRRGYVSLIALGWLLAPFVAHTKDIAL